MKRKSNASQGRVNEGRCACGKIGKLVASTVLRDEVCPRCLVIGASRKGWLRESDVRLLPREGGNQS